MATKDDGGAAFAAPSVYVDENTCPRRVEDGTLGMSLRDYFAAAVLTASISRIEQDDELPDPLWVAEYCYRYADAMLKARGA
jgi:hypothetical protein